MVSRNDTKRGSQMYRIENELKHKEDIYDLYERLNWNKYVKKSKEEIYKVMIGSYYVVYVYDQDKLIATGRMISDGFLTALICGVGVDPIYQNQGLGKMIVKHLKDYGTENALFVELTCVEGLESYYNELGFNRFAISMK